MDLIAPLGPVYQAGTLSGNPLAMAAGLAMLRFLTDHPDVYPRMEQLSAKLVDGILDAARTAGVAMTANRVGSMFTWFFGTDSVTNWDTAVKADTKKFGRFHNAMLHAGVWLPPSQFEAAFLSAAHSEQDVEDTIAAAREALANC
jgi:glutamate-1-semialdehyde 2,1-aminomutase